MTENNELLQPLFDEAVKGVIPQPVPQHVIDKVLKDLSFKNLTETELSFLNRNISVMRELGDKILDNDKQIIGSVNTADGKSNVINIFNFEERNYTVSGEAIERYALVAMTTSDKEEEETGYESQLVIPIEKTDVTINYTCDPFQSGKMMLSMTISVDMPSDQSLIAAMLLKDGGDPLLVCELDIGELSQTVCIILDMKKWKEIKMQTWLSVPVRFS